MKGLLIEGLEKPNEPVLLILDQDGRCALFTIRPCAIRWSAKDILDVYETKEINQRLGSQEKKSARERIRDAIREAQTADEVIALVAAMKKLSEIERLRKREEATR